MKANFTLGTEFGYATENVDVEILATGTNGMSVVRLPAGFDEQVGTHPSAVVEADGSLVFPVCQDYLINIMG